MADISINQQIEEVEREIRMREQVYPRRVSERKMKQAQADRELSVMRAVLTRLKGLETVHG